MTLSAWIAAAERDPAVFLPRLQPHGAGMAVGLASAVLGAALVRWQDLPGREPLAWISLAGVLAGMWMHGRWKRADGGWRVDFERRRVEPVGQPGDGQQIEGAGWSLQIAPSERRANLAIDLRHADRGRVARLLDMPARRRADMAAVSRLADTLARRLDVERAGPRLDA